MSINGISSWKPFCYDGTNKKTLDAHARSISLKQVDSIIQAFSKAASTDVTDGHDVKTITAAQTDQDVSLDQDKGTEEPQRHETPAARMQREHEEHERLARLRANEPAPAKTLSPAPKASDFPKPSPLASSTSSKAKTTDKNARAQSCADIATDGMTGSIGRNFVGSMRSASKLAPTITPQATPARSSAKKTQSLVTFAARDLAAVTPIPPSSAGMPSSARAASNLPLNMTPEPAASVGKPSPPPRFAQPTESSTRRNDNTLRGTPALDPSPTKSTRTVSPKRASLPVEWASPVTDRISRTAVSPDKSPAKLSMSLAKPEQPQTWANVARAKKGNSYMSPTEATKQRELATRGDETVRKSLPRLALPQLGRAASPTADSIFSDETNIIIEPQQAETTLGLGHESSSDDEEPYRGRSLIDPRDLTATILSMYGEDQHATGTVFAPSTLPVQYETAPDQPAAQQELGAAEAQVDETPDTSNSPVVRRRPQGDILEPVRAKLVSKGVMSGTWELVNRSAPIDFTNANKAVQAARDRVSSANLRRTNVSELGSPDLSMKQTYSSGKGVSPRSPLRPTAQEFVPQIHASTTGPQISADDGEFVDGVDISPRTESEWSDLSQEQRKRILVTRQKVKENDRRLSNAYSPSDARRPPCAREPSYAHQPSHARQPSDAAQTSYPTPPLRTMQPSYNTPPAYSTQTPYGAMPPYVIQLSEPTPQMSPATAMFFPGLEALGHPMAAHSNMGAYYQYTPPQPRTDDSSVAGAQRSGWEINANGSDGNGQYKWTGGDGREIKFVSHGPAAERSPYRPVRFLSRGHPQIEEGPRMIGHEHHLRGPKPKPRIPLSQKEWQAQLDAASKMPCGKVNIVKVHVQCPPSHGMGDTRLYGYCSKCARVADGSDPNH